MGAEWSIYFLPFFNLISAFLIYFLSQKQVCNTLKTNIFASIRNLIYFLATYEKTANFALS